MTQRRIKIGVARRSYIERYPATITKVTRSEYIEIWSRGDCLIRDTIENVKAYAAEQNLILTATNKLGREIIK